MWVCLLSLWMQLASISRRPSTPHYAHFHVINKVVTEILELRLHNFTNHGYVIFYTVYALLICVPQTSFVFSCLLTITELIHLSEPVSHTLIQTGSVTMVAAHYDFPNAVSLSNITCRVKD